MTSDDTVKVNKRRLEVLKVFYATFITLMDTHLDGPELLGKLRKLSESMKAEVMERGGI